VARIERDQLLEEQIAFYRADVHSYEAWCHEVFERSGGGAFGAACRRDRQGALNDLALLGPHGDTLELASGTGFYTSDLLNSAGHVTAVDASAESLALARAKLASAASRLTFVEADLFHWRPIRRYRTIFFAYWLSHVPLRLFEPFWQLVADALAPNGRVYLIDSTGAQSNPGLPGVYREHDDLRNQISTRELDGRVYQVVKVPWTPGDLEARLAKLGWRTRFAQGELSFWGVASREQSAA
jgi:demethylmenaquinone methyltransferase/2-methoxy-6-polyprenyl-1,4-benzoquinol methylase